MAIAWFLCPYRVRPLVGDMLIRYPAIDDFTAAIESAGGAWAETEIMGDRAIVKVRAPATVIKAIAAEPDFQRLPNDIAAIKTALGDDCRCRRKPRREANGEIVFDGPEQPVRPLEDVDRAVR